jgi:hypothetical protein
MKISYLEDVQKYKIIHIFNLLILEYNKQNAYEIEALECRRLF